MDKFDQWYNKKMDEQEVAYSESSWDSFSQQLNQLPGSKKRRRPFMYLWVLALSVIIGAGSIFAWNASESKGFRQEVLNSKNGNNNAEDIPGAKSKSHEDVYENISEPLAANPLSESPSASSETDVHKIDRFPEGVNKSISFKSAANQKSVDSVSAKMSDNQNHDSDIQIKSDIERPQVTSGNKKSDTSFIGLVNADMHPSKVMKEENLFKASALTSEESAMDGTEVLEKSSGTSEGNGLAVARADFLEIAPLSNEIKLLEYTSLSLRVPEKGTEIVSDISPTIINCCLFKKWTHHAELGAQFYPGVNQGSRFFTGLQSAYHLQYRWAQRWSASAGAGVLQRWGSFGGFQDSPQDIYTTTRVRRGFLLVPTSATYIQVPTMVNFHAGRHNIGAGIRTLFLVGVKGQLEEYQLQRDAMQSDFSFNSNTVNKGWINESGFRSLVPEFLLSYSYQLSSHWSVSVNGGWMPNGIVFGDKSNENFDLIESLTASIPNDTQQPYLLEDKWQIGIALRYKF